MVQNDITSQLRVSIYMRKSITRSKIIGDRLALDCSSYNTCNTQTGMWKYQQHCEYINSHCTIIFLCLCVIQLTQVNESLGTLLLCTFHSSHSDKVEEEARLEISSQKLAHI